MPTDLKMLSLPCEAKKKVAVWLALPSALGDFPRDDTACLRSIQRSIFIFIFHLLKEMKVFLVSSKGLANILDELIADNELVAKDAPDWQGGADFYSDDFFRNSKTFCEEVKQALAQKSEKLFIVDLPYDDIWLRDTAPLFLSGGHSLSFIFNGWGEKFPFASDRQMARRLLVETENFLQIPYVEKHKKSELIAEGGGMEGNGRGVLIVTKSVFCHPNRGGKKTEEVSSVLKSIFDVRTLIFLAGGLIDDDTDGHVDNVARFVDEKTLLCLTPASFEEDDKEAKTLKRNWDILQEQLKGEGVKIFPFPRIALDRRRKILEAVAKKNQPIPSASYLNFFIAEKNVYVPIFFFDEEEKSTLQHLKSFFPEKNLVGIDWRVGVLGGGGLHCLTQPVFQ